jgi:hypothetical protein
MISPFIEVQVNEGTGIEIISKKWFDSAPGRDEQLFLAGRGLYYAADDGVDRIHNALLPGGLADKAMGPLKYVLVSARDALIKSYREEAYPEADAFGFKAAVRAGADPQKVLSYVRRLSEEKEKATPFKELWFEGDRAAALEQVAKTVSVAGVTGK